MELLMDAASPPSAGHSVAQPGGAARRRGLSLAGGVSIAVHGALLAAALALPAYHPADDVPATEVEVIAAPPPPPSAAVESPKPAVVRPVVLRRARPVEAPEPVPAAPPPPEEQPAPEPTPAVASAPTPEVSSDPRAVLVAAAPAGAGVTGGGPGVPGGGRPTPGVATEGQRRNLAERYRDELMRTRIRDHFRYPAEARDLELTGSVIVQVTVDRNGRLLAARLTGACPHRLLCEDGLRTVRASAPFPALPADLGDSLRIEIPLKYDFQ
jgi:protein TonB